MHTHGAMYDFVHSKLMWNMAAHHHICPCAVSAAMKHYNWSTLCSVSVVAIEDE